MMHVFGFRSEVVEGPAMTSSATYTRIPARNTVAYDEIATRTAPPSSDPAVTTRHRVSAGENLTTIVRDHLRAQGKTPSNSAVYDGVRQVAAANGLQNANLIHPGQDLDLRILSGEPAAHAALPTVSPVSSRVDPLASLAPQRLNSVTPLAPVSQSAPVDVLREQAITRSASPVKIDLPSDPPAAVPRSLQAKGEVPRDEVASTAVGGVEKGITSLQRLLNGTANTLELVRDLMGQKHEEKVATVSSNPWDSILKGNARLSSNYGMRKDPFTGRLGFHGGIDLAAKRGTEITALRDGEVVFSGWKGGYGNTVIVRHDDGFESVYGHTSKNLVAVGDTVNAGTVIANVGSTGRSTGPHLHLEMRRHGQAVNPMPHLEDAPLTLAQRDGSGK